MTQVLNTFVGYVIPAIFVLGLLIFIHELGHFLFAKLVGIRVERFSLGFPPRLIGKKIGDTDYCISAIPFGGYVKMAGMIDESMDKSSIKGEPWEFMSKPLWARSLVIFGGPLFNILLTILIFSIGIMTTGIYRPTESARSVVGSVIPKSPAESIGLQEGDFITKIDSLTISTWDELVRIVHASGGRQLQLEWQRQGGLMSATVTPEFDKLDNVARIGIGPETVHESVNPLAALGLGVQNTWNLTKMIGKSFGKLLTGQIPFKDGLAGPVRISKMAGDVAKSGFASLLAFAALLSLNLGILNLLPIPVLDGGHLLLMGIEGVTRRPISVKAKLMVQQIGMVLLLALMLFAIINDFTHLIRL